MKEMQKNDRTRYDFSNPETLEKVRRSIHTAFEQTGSIEELSEDHTLDRRKEAVLRIVRAYDEQFSDQYPDLNVADELIRLSTPIHTLTFDRLNSVYDYELAAAIWILDYLKSNELYDQAVVYFPKLREEINSVYLPNLSDSVHSDDELRSMIYLIRNRNGGEQHEGEPSDKNHFDAILSLIEKSDIRFAQDRFISLIREFFNSVLSVISSSPSKDLEKLYANILLVWAYKYKELSDDEELTELFSGVTISQPPSPYEMCFAFLTLSDADSDEVWSYNLCYDVLEFVCRTLPWAGFNVVDPDDALDELSVDYAYMQSLVERVPDWSDDRTNEILYQQSIPSPFVCEERPLISPSQLVFLSSGMIPPRLGRSISYTKLLLNESSFSKEQQDLLYEYISFAYSVNHKDPDFSTPDEDEVAQELSKDREDIRDKEQEIKKLRSEIKHLKNIVNQTEHKYRDLSAKLREANSKLDVSNTELSELRSMIRESIDREEESPVSVAFPYSVNKRTVIIGGHQSWMNAMKPLIVNARYIAASEQPNTAVILNAEVVWIQTNAISHSSFYKIIDVIRRNHIPVCYFSYSSAEKCAEQIALYDSGEDGEES